MKSATKATLSAEQLNLLVRSVFGEGISIADSEELEDGWFNTAFRIRISGSNDGSDAGGAGEGSGQTFILKVGPPEGVLSMRYERNMMGAEVEALRLMAEVHIPVPRVYGYDASRTLIGSEYFFMECLKGQPLNKVIETMEEEQQELIRESLGALNKRINDITGTKFGCLGQKERQTEDWAACFLGLTGDLLLDAADLKVELPASAAEITAVFRRGKAALQAVTVPRLVHWDLWDGNVFVQDGQMTGIIDCERALWADPLMEYYFRSPAVTEAFKRGYGLSRLTPEEEKRSLLYDMYLNLIWHIECTFRDYDNQEHRDWAKNNLWSGWEEFRSAI